MPDLTEQLAEALAEHADCITDCKVKATGVVGGEMTYSVAFNCGAKPSVFDVGQGIVAAHRAHQVAQVLPIVAAAIQEARAEGFRAAVSSAADAAFPSARAALAEPEGQA